MLPYTGNTGMFKKINHIKSDMGVKLKLTPISVILYEINPDFKDWSKDINSINWNSVIQDITPTLCPEQLSSDVMDIIQVRKLDLTLICTFRAFDNECGVDGGLIIL